MVQKINDYINSDVKYECCSRLFTKNMVYHVYSKEGEFAIKKFIKGENKKSRYEIEKNINSYFDSNKIINVPKIIVSSDNENCPYLVLEWIKGESLKKNINRETLEVISGNIKSFFCDLEKIWNSYDNSLDRIIKPEFIGIEKRLNKDLDEIFILLNSLHPMLKNYNIQKMYFDLLQAIDNRYSDKLINGDVSAHEYIINGNQGFWLDFESYKKGNPNNDLARAFVSLTNNKYYDQNFMDYVFDIISHNQYYNQNDFIYYVFEKIVCNAIVAPEQTSDDEIIAYLNFIQGQMSLKKRKLVL